MAHGAPDYHQNVLIMGNDGDNNKQVFVNSEGKIITLMQGQFEGVAQTIAVDGNGNITTLIQGEHEGTPKTVSLDENGNMSIQTYGEMSLLSPFRTIQKMEDGFCVDATNATIHGSKDFDYIYFNSSYYIQLKLIGTTYVRFDNFGFDISSMPYLYLLVKAEQQNITATFRLIQEDAAYRDYSLPITTAWQRLKIDVADYIDSSGTWNYGIVKQCQINFPDAGLAQDIIINGLLGSQVAIEANEKKQVRLGDNGGFLTELTAFYNNHIRTLQTDINSNLKTDIGAVSVGNVPVKQKRYPLQVEYFLDGSTQDNQVLFTFTNSAGCSNGGVIYINFGDSVTNFKTCAIELAVDGVYLNSPSIADMIYSAMDNKNVYPYYLISENSTSKVIKLGISPGWHWTTQLSWRFDLGDASNIPGIEMWFSYHNE